MAGIIPGPEQVSGPVSLRPSGANPMADVSAIDRGAQALAGGLDHFAGQIDQREAEVMRRQRVSDVAKADTAWLSGTLDLGKAFEKDPDYKTFETRAEAQTGTLKSKAAGLIRDEATRQQWEDATEQKRLSLVSAIRDHGQTISDSNDRADLEDVIDQNAKLIADPTVPDVVREQAKATIATSITVAKNSGLIDAESARKLRIGGLETSDEQLSINRAELDINIDPQRALTGLAVPTTGTDAGLDQAIAASNGGTPPALDYSLAKVTADLLGDANFPTDPKLAQAYLSDPAKAQQYRSAAIAMLTDRYKGDLGAAVIALDPDGGTQLADRWVQAKHSQWALPEGVRKRYRDTMQNMQAPVTGARIPIVAEDGVDLAGVDPNVLSQYEKLQSAFGAPLPILSGYRDSEHNKAVGGADKSQHLDRRALDIDVSSLPPEKRVQFIQMASAMGFTGIGVYKNSIHIDTGPLRAWGPSYHSDSVPAWAKDAISQHMSGTVPDVPTVYSGVSPRYAALSFDKRLVLADKAKAAMNAKEVNMRASLETVAANAPAAIANNGTYDGQMPTATDFVRAYGADDGIQKWKQFDAGVETSKALYGFRTESMDDILAQVAAAAPGQGNDAANQYEKFNTLSAAADHIRKAREEDPAGYVMSNFPEIGKMYQTAGSDPKRFSEALSAMATAQEKLGIDEPRLLPKTTATDAATKFKDPTLPGAQRIAAVTGLVLLAPDEQQQALIFDQLIDAGLAPETHGAMAAAARGDSGAAQTLFRAAMIDPDKITNAMPADIKKTGDGSISSAIQEQILAPGKIGDIIYGLTGGTADALERAMPDMTLIDRAVKLRIAEGETNVDRAVELTIKDMYGDLTPVVAPGVKIALPASENPAPIQQGLAALKPKVADALRADMMGQEGIDALPAHDGTRARVAVGIDNSIDLAMSDGYFVNAGEGAYQYFNPYTGAVIGGPDGQPLIFDRSDVLAAGATSQAAPTQRFMPGMGGR
jgi:hypothetical protein